MVGDIIGNRGAEFLQTIIAQSWNSDAMSAPTAQ